VTATLLQPDFRKPKTPLEPLPSSGGALQSRSNKVNEMVASRWKSKCLFVSRMKVSFDPVTQPKRFTPMIITRDQVEEVIAFIERLSEARKNEGCWRNNRSFDEIVDDPERRELVNYLYSLSSEARGELITLMLI
jgi:hypothetical protein